MCSRRKRKDCFNMSTVAKVFSSQNQGGHLRIGVAPWDNMNPECLLQTRRNCDPGPELEIFAILILLLNFTVEIKYSTSPGCGNINSEGIWSGLIGMLQRNEIDVIGNLCVIDETRTNQSWMKISWPVLQQKQAFLIRTPTPDNTFRILAPFSGLVWVSLAMISILFMCLFGLTYFYSKQFKFQKSLTRACSDTFKLIFNFDCPLISSGWFFCLCFVGFVLILYSTFITVAVLKLPDIERPFKGHVDISDLLMTGFYKRVDNRNPPSTIRCYNQEVCSKLQEGVERNKFHYVNVSGLITLKRYSAKEATKVLLDELVAQPNLVLMHNKIFLRIYLHSYREREKLWLLNDDDSGEEWYSYFYRNSSNLLVTSLFDKVLILMGDSKQRIINWYVSLSHFAPNSNVIKGQFLPDSTRLNITLIWRMYIIYIVGVAVGVTVLVIEILYAQRRKKTFHLEQIGKINIKIASDELTVDFAEITMEVVPSY